MKEAAGNLWDYPADAIVITTNGFVKSNGAAVMGRGCAKEAMLKYPGIEYELGRQIKNIGNRVSMIHANPTILAFPVKHNWWEKADPALIKKSAGELLIFQIFGNVKYDGVKYNFKTFVLPRPGCGNGQLNWADVKPLLEPLLDDAFTVITYA